MKLNNQLIATSALDEGMTPVQEKLFSKLSLVDDRFKKITSGIDELADILLKERKQSGKDKNSPSKKNKNESDEDY